jgi:acetyl/propionyl-CoA carboxylase alpha subunit
MRTGLDIVELQLRVAAGEPLPFAQEDIRFEGHVTEFRINAEDPWDGFRPSSGRLEHFEPGSVLAPETTRLDAGFEQGDAVPPQYDSLLGKLIVTAGSRSGALTAGAATLARFGASGVRTNVNLLRGLTRALRDREPPSISWLERNLPALLAASKPPDAVVGAVRAALAGPPDVPRGAPPAPRWLGAGAPVAWLDDGSDVHEMPLAAPAVSTSHDAPAVRSGDVTVFIEGSRFVAIPQVGDPWLFRVVPPPPLPRRAVAAVAGATAITAPLAGTIAEVRVVEGDTVDEGLPVIILEAMKMEHRIPATRAGTVARVAVRPGDVVREGDILVELA